MALPIVLAVLAAGAATAGAQQGGGGSAFEKLDENRLAKRLGELKMRELLKALGSGRVSPERVKALADRARGMIAAAGKTPDLDKRDRLLDEAMRVLDEVVRASAGAVGYKHKVAHYEYSLLRVVTQGIDRCEPYVERIQYLLERSADAAVVGKHTGEALRLLTRLLSRMESTREAWADEPEAMITRALWKLEDLFPIVRYKGAWISYYRALSLSPKDPQRQREREALLSQAIAAVEKFANQTEDESGVKFHCLLLSGMACAQLGQWDKARDFLKRVEDKAAPRSTRLQALFVIVRCRIDQKRFAEAEDALKTFRRSGTAIMGKGGEVSVLFQEMLLRRHMLRTKAAVAGKIDAARAEELLAAARKLRRDFVAVRPEYSSFFDVADSYTGVPVSKIPTSELIDLGDELLGKKGRTPGETERARQAYQEVLRREKAGAHKPAALWGLGHLANQQKDDLGAAEAWSRLAAQYPKDANAKQAVLNAARAYDDIVRADHGGRLEKVPKDFLKKYAAALEMLVSRHGAADRKARTWNYELGQVRERLGDPRRARLAYEALDPSMRQYMSARQRVLDMRVRDMRGAPQADSTRRREARDLIGDLRRYRDRAIKFAASSENESQVGQVRWWAARCDVWACELRKDVLAEPAETVADIRAAAKRWADMPDVLRRCRELLVEAYLDAGRTDQAIQAVSKLVQADALIARLVTKLRDDIDRLRYAPGPQAAARLETAGKAYRVLTRRLYESVRRRLKGKELYPYRQELGNAYLTGSDEQVGEAVKIFEELLRVDSKDSRNILGLARGRRRLGQADKALRLYDRLIRGLKAENQLWWRVQLERLEFYIEMHKGRPDKLKDVLLQIKMLRFRDSRFGGLADRFYRMEHETKKVVGE